LFVQESLRTMDPMRNLLVIAALLSPALVGMQKYDLLPVIPMPQLLVGYELDVLK
jgi:hypothetical protein